MFLGARLDARQRIQEPRDAKVPRKGASRPRRIAALRPGQRGQVERHLAVVRRRRRGREAAVLRNRKLQDGEQLLDGSDYQCLHGTEARSRRVHASGAAEHSRVHLECLHNGTTGDWACGAHPSRRAAAGSCAIGPHRV